LRVRIAPGAPFFCGDNAQWPPVSKKSSRISLNSHGISDWHSLDCCSIWIDPAQAMISRALGGEEIRARVKAADEGRVVGIPYEQIKKKNG
jgi:hypothetical protein